MYKKIASVIMLAMVVSSGAAPGEATATECSRLLANGVFDTTKTYYARSHFSNFQNWACDTTVSRKERETVLSGKLEYLDAGVAIGGESKGRDTASRTLCTRDFSALSDNVLFVQTITAASKDLTEAFNKCLKETPDSMRLESWLEVEEDPRELTYRIQYWAGRTAYSDAEVTKVEALPSGLEDQCKGLPKPGDRITQQGLTATCQRDPKRPATIRIETSAGPSEARASGIVLSILEIKETFGEISGRSAGPGKNTPVYREFKPDEGWSFMPKWVSASISNNRDTYDGDGGTGHFVVLSESPYKAELEICTRANHSGSIGSTAVKVSALEGRWIDVPYDERNPMEMARLMRQTEENMSRVASWSPSLQGKKPQPNERYSSCPR